MSHEFLKNFKIPTVVGSSIQRCESKGNELNDSALTNCTDKSPVNIDRFIPPGKHGTGYCPPSKLPVKRKANLECPKVEAIHSEPVLFLGRDETYPAELNSLIQPLHCGVCNSTMNSAQSAKDHYFSKVHDRGISSWLSKNYTEKGLEPPAVKRLVKDGPKGPEAFYCEVCDLKLTSLVHASQHYSGRKHKLAASGCKPSGAGYYSEDGKWIRTGTKATPVAPNDGRFGIGESFATTDNSPADEPLYCKMCAVHTTSMDQMHAHLEGTKHRKKLANNGGLSQTEASPDADRSDPDAMAVDTVENNSEFANYRTPSGTSYYCPVCNVSLGHVNVLQQHLQGRKHLKKAAEEKAKSKAV